VREVLKQAQYATLPAPAQVATLLVVTAGLLDPVPLDRVAEATRLVHDTVRVALPEVWYAIARGERLTDSQREAVLAAVRPGLAALAVEGAGGDA
jgi:F-type H+-transporting ATPase subunit alpha